MKKIIVFIFYFIALHVYAQQGNDLIQVTDLLKVKQVGNVTITPDGNQAAFTVTSVIADPDKEGDYKFQTQLYLMPANGSQPARQLTYSNEGASQPAWSPDGRQLAFVRTVEGKGQVFLLSLAGGEPVQLTNFQYGANGPQWSPDGRFIMFTSGIALNELLSDTILNPNRETPRWSYEKPGFFENENLKKASGTQANPNGSLAEIRAYLDKNEKDNKAKVINQLQFQEEATTSSSISLSHIFLIEVRPGATPKDLTPGFSSCRNPSFMPNGRSIIFEGDYTQDEHPDRAMEVAIFSVNTDGSGLRELVGQKGFAYGGTSISPSGKWMAFQYSPTMQVGIPKMGLLPVGGKPADLITIPYDRNKSNFTWTANDRYVYFTSPSNGGVVLNRVDTRSRKVEQLTDFNSGVTSFDVKGNRLVFARTEVANPSELFVADASAKGARRVSAFNQDWVAKKRLSMPEKREFTNDKGQKVEYWIMKPTNFEAGKKYPVVLEIHGGPTAMWGPGESSMWHEYQYFCSRGYGVVYSNPRGSGGYGEEFMRANINDWGAGPARDVLTALDNAVADGWADTSRLAITGGSYGGYLVSWILGHDKRFKAACAQRGVYDLTTFFGEGNAWRLVPNYFGGYPWEENARPVIQRESPLTYVQNITTPLIIFHGESDLRTGVIQSEMLYKSLKVMQRPVEYVRHPGATHEITRSGNNRQRIDQMLRTYEFFERWLGANSAQ
jgi:dipeptidyl aminopeptidase/acylaminoacyl peptidase